MRGLLLVLLLLPTALLAQDDDATTDDIWDEEAWDEWDEGSSTQSVSGFLEVSLGGRTGNDPVLDESLTLAEARGRMESEWQPGALTLALKADLGYDQVEHDVIADFRELTAGFRLGSATDIKLGRQINTWGVGDLVFLNDLFPKDYVSFFAGRDDEYLKAPGDSMRLTHYGSVLNADFVWSPRFDPDIYLTGERFSFFAPPAGANVAPDPPFSAVEPDHDFANGEFALRLFRSVNGTELAAYFYRGFFKQPTAVTDDGRATFAPLNSYGASIRRPWGTGLVSGEFAWYDSRDDSDGSNPGIPNSQLRVLAGYEWEARPNFTIGLQYYLEHTLDHRALLQNSPWPEIEADEYRHLLTNRLTWHLARERYTLSLFTFWSPSDSDFYLRPVFTFRRDDHWQWIAGANLFGGQDEHTFFNQLRDASNVYLRLRYNY
jgi:hypothetical protein